MKKDFSIIFWLHLLFILIAWTSPLWFDWKLIVIGVIILALQYLIIGGCYLTFLEAGKDLDETFYHYHLSKTFPKLNKKKVKIFVRYILPILIIVIAYIIQNYLGYKPLINVE
jgi:hypothetical protein